MLTRGYRVVRPPWGRPSPSPFRCKIAGATSSLPSSRQHVVVVPRSSCLYRYRASAMLPSSSPFRCKIAGATPSPSPSRQHVAVVPRSSYLHLCSRCAKLSAPQGSHYSVTAGERSEPAEGACPHHHRPQGGRTLVACVRVCRVPASLGWQLSTGLLLWLALQSVCLFDPLGAVHIYVWLSFRGFAMLTRGYRVVRPLGAAVLVAIPLQNRGSDAVPAVIPAACRGGTAVPMPMSVQRIRGAAVPVAIPAACRCDTAVPVAIPAACRCDTAVPMPTSVQAFREAAGPAGVALLCNRG